MSMRRLGLCLWLLAMGALYFFENNTATRCLLIVSLCLPPLFVLLAALAARRMRLTLTAPAEVQKGEDFSLTVALSAPLPFAALQGMVFGENLLTGERIELPLTAAQAYTLSAQHCGGLRLWAQCRVTDLLGLSAWPVALGGESLVQIRPTLFLPQLTLRESGGSADSAVSIRPGSDMGETFSLREYVPGDPIRQIHWKLSEKTGTVFIREPGMAVSEQVLLALDGAGVEDAPPVCLDALAEVFFSLSRALLSQETPHTLCWRHEGGEAELFCVAGEADLLAAEERFFSAPLERTMPLLPTAEPYAHAAILRLTLPVGDELCGFGRALTVLAPTEGAIPNGAYQAVTFSPAHHRLFRVEL